MDDLISRQAAIDAMNDVIVDYIPTLFGHLQEIPLELALAIERLPAAEPRKGKWIVQITGWGDMYYECSYCKGAITLIDGTPEDNFYCYCPHCGVRMEES